MRHTNQTELSFPDPKTWGGRRKGAGRPRKQDSGVPHLPRATVSRHDPRMVTMKLAGGLPRLRNPREGRTIIACIRAAQRDEFRIVHFSIQQNHLHLIVEADETPALASGMKGLSCRIARQLNRLWGRTGPVFAHRFHDSVLRSLRQVRNALRYVLNNYLKHGCRPWSDGNSYLPDSYSSGRYFDGWLGRAADELVAAEGSPVVEACWKIRKGWKRRYRRIALDVLPA